MDISSFFNIKSGTSAIKKLLGWRQSDEDEKWAEKAVEALVKKLKNKKGQPNAVADLESALANPDKPSKCVTIPRSQDGRLQVSHRKGLPHVIYSRVWRWPDLQSHHELKALDCCQFPFDALSNKDVCINPYHYQRVESSVLPPVLVPRQDSSRSYTNPMMYKMEEGSNFTFDPPFSPPSSARHNMFSPIGGPHSPYHHHHSPSPPYSPQLPNHHDRHRMDFDDMVPIDHSNGLALNPETARAIIPLDITPMWCSIQYFELNVRVGEPFHVSNVDGLTGVSIDGFTDPSDNGRRFSLGQLSNIMRNSTIENTRKNIGRGIHIWCAPNESGALDVWVECLCAGSVFVQSRESNVRHNHNVASILKLSNGMKQIIFSYESFANMLRQRATLLGDGQAYEAVFELQKMCVIRISFVKGWGADYNRQDVTSTPCWIEMRLHTPLKWLDQTISQLSPPNIFVSSQS